MPKPPRRSTSRPAGGARPTAGARPSAAPADGARPVRPKRIGRQPVRTNFLERNRTRLVAAAAVVVFLGLGALFYVQATAPAYACGIEWTAPATSSPAPGATPRLGYQQPDMGRDHVTAGTAVKYLYCPPASGNHYNVQGQGPIEPRLYGPNDRALPEGWIHNLEHGGLVLVYKCPGDACTSDGQAALQQLWATWPASPICNIPAHQISPVIARFDQMAYPYAAIVWDEVLPLQTLDSQQILAFYARQAERTNPEKQPGCAAASGAPSASPAATDAGAPSAPASDLPSPTVAPSAG